MAVVHIIESVQSFPELPIQDQKRKVAVYARVSTDHEEQKSSLAAQMDYYQKMIADHCNWEYVGTYADDGISGTGIRRRKQFMQMIEDCEAGKIDLILTKSVSRFARNTVDAVKTLRELKQINVEVFFQKENIWTGRSEGEFLITLMSSFAQEESRSISENITWGQRKRFSDGGYSVSYGRFLGYDMGMVVNENEAATIRKIYRYFLAGGSPNSIAVKLSKQKTLTPAGKEKWSATTVASILSNEKYKGDALLQKTYSKSYLTKKSVKNKGELPQYYVTGGHEEIINREVFDYVQTKMQEVVVGEKYNVGVQFFSNRIFCCRCHRAYGSKNWHSTTTADKVWVCLNRNVKSIRCRNAHFYEEGLNVILGVVLKTIIKRHPQIIKICEKLVKETVRDSNRKEAALAFLHVGLFECETPEVQTTDIGIILKKIYVDSGPTIEFEMLNGDRITITNPQYSPCRGWKEMPRVTKYRKGNTR